MFLSCLFAAAFAGDVFASAEEEVTIGGGTWARTAPSDDGWYFFEAFGGNAWVGNLTDDLQGYDERALTNLTNHGSLQDVQVERCPDGGWLLAGSFTQDSFDDSAHAWFYDADFTVQAEVTIEEREPARAHNDMVVLCNQAATAVVYSNASNAGSGLIPLTEAGPGAVVEVDWAAMGGSMALRASDQQIVAADINGPQDDAIRLSVFDPSGWSMVDQVQVPLAADTAFWPQRLLPLDDGWVLAYLVRPADERMGDGEVWLMALDAELSVVDTFRVSAEGTLNARPWVSRKGDVLAVSYDRDVKPRITLVHLQSGAVPDDDDTGPTGDTDGGDTAADTDGDAPACGCGGSAAPALLVLAPLVVRRRIGGRGR